jgi:hypothetical protein
VTTERYSVFKAESQDHSDPFTGLNKRLLHDLNSEDTKVNKCLLACGLLI